MRAVRLHHYGDPDALVLEDVARPTMGLRDLRIAVHATSINPVDAKIRAGMQRAIIRLELPWTLGMDVSGTVLEVGRDVQGFKVGDEVFASPGHQRMGCYAEEVVVRANEVAHKPRTLTHVQAASLPLVGLTAWDALVDALRVGPGQRVLIQAGAGGVGTVAIQLARHLGADVLTTASERNADLVRELGASTVIDYRNQDFEQVAQGVDAILESVGGDAVDKAIRTVRRGGRVALITTDIPTYVKRHGPTLGVLAAAMKVAQRTISARVSRGVAVKLVTRKPRGDRLAKLAELVDAGAIRPVVEQVLPLDALPKAHRDIESGRTRGKIVVQVAA